MGDTLIIGSASEAWLLNLRRIDGCTDCAPKIGDLFSDHVGEDRELDAAATLAKPPGRARGDAGFVGDSSDGGSSYSWPGPVLDLAGEAWRLRVYTLCCDP